MKRIIESFGNAAAAIGPISRGMSLFGITRGQFSLIDICSYLISQIEHPVRVSIWTWAIADYEVDAMGIFLAKGEITHGTLVVDRSAEKRKLPTIDDWRSKFGPDSVRVVLNHSKIATIESPDGMRFLIRGSMNLNFNPRFEQFDIDEGHPGFDLVKRLENELPPLRLPTYPTTVKASKVHDAFSSETLKLFGDFKPWKI